MVYNAVYLGGPVDGPLRLLRLIDFIPSVRVRLFLVF
jgi:hypothetical protein